MRYSQNFNRDWQFYIANMSKFTFGGIELERFLYDENGVDAKKAFHTFDSEGKRLPNRDPVLVAKVIHCKRAINLQIKLWAEGYEDCLQGVTDYLSVFALSVPDWVESALRSQIRKAYLRRKASGIELYNTALPLGNDEEGLDMKKESMKDKVEKSKLDKDIDRKLKIKEGSKLDKVLDKREAKILKEKK